MPFSRGSRGQRPLDKRENVAVMMTATFFFAWLLFVQNAENQWLNACIFLQYFEIR
jgi:hypothetical protein